MAGSIDHDDWDAHWVDYAAAAQHSPAQIYRRRLTLRLLDRYETPRRLVDLGCGPGDLLYDARRRWPDAELLGLEMSAKGVELGIAKVPGAQFLQVDLVSGGVPSDGRFSAWGTHAVCSEVLEHVDDPVALLRNARYYLQPGAYVIVTVPGGPISAFDRHIGHRRHYTPQLLAQTLSDAGLLTATVDGAGFPFFNLYRRFVITRGSNVINDVLAHDRRLTPAARLAMLAFNPLLAVSLPRSRWGTQMVGVAYEPPLTRAARPAARKAAPPA